MGLVFALRPRRPASLARAAAAALLGTGLAAPVVLVMRANMSAGERAHGFAPDVVLNQSVHPFTLLQVVIANLYGDLARLPDRWWGSNFFDRGFPYILSLYLGATVLALAFTGAWTDRRRSARLLVLTVIAVVVALGRYGGLETVVAALPDSWRVFRYPTKAFFTVHLCVALLAAIGVRQLSRGRGWRVFLSVSLVLAVPLVLAPAAPVLMPSGASWFVAHFFPPAMGPSVRAANFRDLVGDAARGGGLALAAAVRGGGRPGPARGSAGGRRPGGGDRRRRSPSRRRGPQPDDGRPAAGPFAGNRRDPSGGARRAARFLLSPGGEPRLLGGAAATRRTATRRSRSRRGRIR